MMMRKVMSRMSSDLLVDTFGTTVQVGDLVVFCAEGYRTGSEYLETQIGVGVVTNLEVVAGNVGLTVDDARHPGTTVTVKNPHPEWVLVLESMPVTGSAVVPEPGDVVLDSWCADHDLGVTHFVGVVTEIAGVPAVRYLTGESLVMRGDRDDYRVLGNPVLPWDTSQ